MCLYPGSPATPAVLGEWTQSKGPPKGTVAGHTKLCLRDSACETKRGVHRAGGKEARGVAERSAGPKVAGTTSKHKMGSGKARASVLCLPSLEYTASWVQGQTESSPIPRTPRGHLPPTSHTPSNFWECLHVLGAACPLRPPASASPPSQVPTYTIMPPALEVIAPHLDAVHAFPVNKISLEPPHFSPNIRGTLLVP